MKNRRPFEQVPEWRRRRANERERLSKANRALGGATARMAAMYGRDTNEPDEGESSGSSSDQERPSRG